MAPTIITRLLENSRSLWKWGRFSTSPEAAIDRMHVTALRACHLSALYFIFPILQMGIIILAQPTSQDC